MTFTIDEYEFAINLGAGYELWRGNDFLGYHQSEIDAKIYAEKYVQNLKKLKASFGYINEKCPPNIF